MKCLLCGGEYRALGVHIRHKHGVDPDDYRDDFGILRTTPLVDGDLSAQMSTAATARLEDEEFRSECVERCKINAAARTGLPGPGMTRAGKEALASRNAARNKAYLASMAPRVSEILKGGGAMMDVRRGMGMGRQTALNMVSMGLVSYSADQGREEGKRRAAAALKDRAARRRERSVAPESGVAAPSVHGGA